MGGSWRVPVGALIKKDPRILPPPDTIQNRGGSCMIVMNTNECQICVMHIFIYRERYKYIYIHVYTDMNMSEYVLSIKEPQRI